jgi:ABC-type uncharacterized transport system fused permease/ATPase subunit
MMMKISNSSIFRTEPNTNPITSTADNPLLHKNENIQINCSYLMNFLSDINLLKNILSCRFTENNIDNSQQSYIDNNWLWIYLLMCISLVFEIVSILVMPILGSFYSAIQDRNIDLFITTLIKATILVAMLGLIRSARSYVSDRFSLALRIKIVSTIHTNYMHEYSKERKCHKSEDELPLDNIDQRCTQDVKDCTDRLSQLIQSVIICPFVIIFYSIYLSIVLSFLAPIFFLLYFLVGTTCATTVQRLQFKSTCEKGDNPPMDLVACIYNQQRMEGDFRRQHAHCVGHVDSIRLLRGEKYERNALRRSFSSLVSNSYRLIFKLFALQVFINFFDYFGSIGMIIAYIHTYILNGTKVCYLIASDLAIQPVQP